MKEEYIKDFDAWSEYKKQINNTELTGHYYERELWWCALGTNIGSEQDGKNESFERPVLIVKKRYPSLAVIVPLTSKITDHCDRVTFTRLGETSQILLSQVRTISERRLLRRIGYIKQDIYNEVIIGLVKLFLENETPPLERGISGPEGNVPTL